jgi:hypothetical protein
VALKGDYDQTTVEVRCFTPGTPGPVEVEQSVFIGGYLVPKSHFLSDQIMMEGVSKKAGVYTYLLVAYRPFPGAPAEITARFRPFFSAYDYWDPWGTGGTPNQMVYKLGVGWVPVNIADGGGWWEDTFHPGDVAIYRFETPEPWQLE